MGRPLVDLSGQRFGRWTVLARDEERLRPVRWLCRCACGTERSVLAATLKDGGSTCCGCVKSDLIDMTGQRFGLLTVVRRAPGEEQAWWEASCECGGTTQVRGSVLRRGESRSCGCRRWPVGEDSHAWRGDDVGYAGAHLRMVRECGPAGDQPCTRCPAIADDWAFLGCADARVEKVGGYWLAYCTHFEHYAPMCRRCHAAEDRANPKAPGKQEGAEAWRYMEGGAA